MVARPYWRGHLRLALVTCGIQLTSSTTEVDKIKLNKIQRGTETRLRQQMINPETQEVVSSDDTVMGYEFEKGRFLEIDSEELNKLKIESSETIDIERVVPADAVDWLYWDTTYLALPEGKHSDEIFATIREALQKKNVVGIGRAVMSRRERPVLVKPHGKGMLLATLRDPAEVRNPDEIFEEIKDVKLDKQNLAMAEALVDRMKGAFDLSLFEDRYQVALKEMIESKVQGKPLRAKRAAAAPGKYGDLFEALKASIKGEGSNKVTQLKPRAKVAPAAAPTKRKKAS